MEKLIKVKNLKTKLIIELLSCDNETVTVDSPIPLQTLLEDISVKLKVKQIKFSFDQLIKEFWLLLSDTSSTVHSRPYLPYYLCSEDSVICSCQASIPLQVTPCSEFCVLYWNIIILPTSDIRYSFDDSKLVIGFPDPGHVVQEQTDLTSQLASQEQTDIEKNRKAIETDQRLFRMNGIINEEESSLIKHLKETF